MAQYVYVTIATKIVVKKTGHYYFGGMEYTMEQIREKLEILLIYHCIIFMRIVNM